MFEKNEYNKEWFDWKERSNCKISDDICDELQDKFKDFEKRVSLGYYANLKKQVLYNDIRDIINDANNNLKIRIYNDYNIIKSDVNNKFSNYVKNFYKILHKEVTYDKDIEYFLKSNNIPKENKILDFLFPSRVSTRDMLEKKALDDFKKYKTEYEKLNKLQIEEINNYNETLVKREENFYKGNKQEVELVVKSLLQRLEYFYDSKIYSKIVFDKSSKTILVQKKVPSKNEICNIKSVNFNRQSSQLWLKFLSEKEHNELYADTVFQIILKLTSELYSFFPNIIDNIIINAEVEDVSLQTGNLEKRTIISLKTNRNEFEKISLNNIIYVECMKSLNANFEFEKNRGFESIIPYELFDNNNSDEISFIDNGMTGIEFENYCKKLLVANGFENVKVTQASNDYGTDLTATKNQIKYAIQCKKYTEKVGVKAIQEVIASTSIYKSHVGVVLTNNYFTPNAIKLANSNNVLLWDRTVLKEMVDIYTNKK